MSPVISHEMMTTRKISTGKLMFLKNYGNMEMYFPRENLKKYLLENPIIML